MNPSTTDSCLDEQHLTGLIIGGYNRYSVAKMLDAGYWISENQALSSIKFPVSNLRKIAIHLTY